MIYLYQTRPKWYRELNHLSEDYEKNILKPNKANGTRWIDQLIQSNGESVG